MKDDRVTLELKGTVPLDMFASAMSALSGLIRALTAEIVGSQSDVEWVVEELSGGSASATIVGQSSNPAMVRNVVEAYTKVGIALSKREPLNFSSAVMRELKQIEQIINGKISAVLMQDTLVFTSDEKVAALDIPQTEKSFVSYGAVEGVVQTLSSRRGLRFTLFDSINDRAVYCYLSPEQHDLMKDYWDQRAIVQGLITRDRQSGRPLEIRRISQVQHAVQGDYRRARGVLAGRVRSVEAPEVTLRRSRDAD